MGNRTGSSPRCPACGGGVVGDSESKGLCLGCVFELALESPTLVGELAESGEAETLVSPGTTLAPGTVLGGRYQIRALLGRGGMGEVWRAFDLKLRVDVALKALLSELHGDEQARERLRQEVRSAREVISPHVCRVFDLIEIDGLELVSMEYIDGITLWTILKARAPLDLIEAREIAIQFLAGIEAIHEADLVHRDIKPENIMMTRSGRVVVMDFGIAKGLAEGSSGTVAGTLAYMAPEQARGEAVTSRADVFSAGVVLAEIVAPGGLQSQEARLELWRRVRRRPPEIADSPWAEVIRRAVADAAGERFASASALALALEEVTLRVAGAEDVRPYPGLASFTEEDAEFFFGRELEIEEMWKKLQEAHLLGLIGPSGAGKSSFLRAGLLAVIPTGWSALVATPGTQPFKALAQALIPEFAGDTEAMREILHFEDPDVASASVGRWRERHDEALLIIDQFEELFTQNPPEVEERFAGLLGRLALEADVHVLVAMRDDFLFRCHPHEALRPLLAELTLLGAPTGASLRRALVQPALKCGYRFVDETLVDEMISEVTAERGALPLLAFAASRLWEHRDSDHGVLTRDAYEYVGGVGGALAKHAEATLEKIGHEHLPIVRELFRNLVTAQGTRAVRDQEELLSVFDDDRAAAGRTLAALVDARLLTTYDEPTEDEGPRKRIEIIHESLLSNWPRLVRWRTQDADSAQLRDQLRQVAGLWMERGRPEDLLWSGTSYQEYEIWRQRYEGGLTEGEEEFAAAMRARATQRRRRRRVMAAAAFGILLVVLAVVGFFWRQSHAAQQRAEQESRRAEASKLLALGQLELAEDHTAALAYATSSLELADTREARLFVLRALAAGPPARVIEVDEKVEVLKAAFSPDGEWLGMSGHRDLRVASRDGGQARLVGTFASVPGYIGSAFSSGSGALFGVKYGEGKGELRMWSVPGFEIIRHREFDAPGEPWLFQTWSTPSGFSTASVEQVEPFAGAGTGPLFQSFSADGQTERTVRLAGTRYPFGIDDTFRWIAQRGPDDPRALLLRPFGDSGAVPRVLGRHAERIVGFIPFDPESSHVIASGSSGEIRIWPVDAENAEPLHVFRGRGFLDERWEQRVWDEVMKDGYRIEVWDLSAPVEALPWTWRSPGPIDETWEPAFSPDGGWLTTVHGVGRALWQLPAERPVVLPIPFDEQVPFGMEVIFSDDGSRLLSLAHGQIVQWDLSPGGRSRVLASASAGSAAVHRLPSSALRRMAIDRGGRFMVASAGRNVVVMPFAEGPIRVLADQGQASAVALDRKGRRVASSSLMGEPEVKAIRIFDLVSGETRAMGPVEGTADGFTGRQNDFEFLPDERMISVGDGGLRLWDIESGTSQVVAPSHMDSRLEIFDEGRRVVYIGVDRQLAFADLDTETMRVLESHGRAISAVTADAAGRVVVTGSDDGTVRVGLVAGGEPYLLYGHQGRIHGVAVSPDGHRIASISDDNTVWVWPMPDLSRSPLQTLPRESLLRVLRNLTNVRVVRDPNSSTGWMVDFDPFPGWLEPPDW